MSKTAKNVKMWRTTSKMSKQFKKYSKMSKKIYRGVQKCLKNVKIN